MHLAGHQVALLHGGGEGGGDRHQGGHAQAHQQVGSHEELAVVEVGHGHATQGAEHHHGQDDLADLQVALGELPLDQGFALLGGGGGAQFLGLDPQVEAIAAQGQQHPHQHGVHEAHSEGNGAGDLEGHGRRAACGQSDETTALPVAEVAAMPCCWAGLAESPLKSLQSAEQISRPEALWCR